jgi:CheY-like chemotaxis protein
MKRVLIAEDDKLIALVLSKGIRLYAPELEVFTAEDGEAACGVLQDKAIDILVTDLLMPRMDGFELIARAISDFPKLPIVIMTALKLASVETELQKIGTFPCLIKPVDVRTLYHCILNELDAQSQGMIHGIGLPSFLQLLEAERKTCTLRITSTGRVGYVYFLEGALADCEANALSGEEAVYDILRWSDPKIQITSECRKSKRVIQSSLMNVLMEGFRRQDEENERRRLTEEADDDDFADALTDALIGTVANLEPTPEVRSQAIRTTESVLEVANAMLSQTPKASLDAVYMLSSELSRRVRDGDLPPGTADLLVLFDGKASVGDIMESAPKQAAALQFLVSGLASTGMLIEVLPSGPPPGATLWHSGDDFPRLSQVESPPAPAPQSYFLPSDAIMLAQAMTMSFGRPLDTTYVAVIGTPAPYRPVLLKTLHRVAETQRGATGGATRPAPAAVGELMQFPVRADMNLALVEIASPEDFSALDVAVRAAVLGCVVFVSAHRPAPAEDARALLSAYAEPLRRPYVVNVLNLTELDRPATRMHIAQALEIDSGRVDSWSLQRPDDIAAMLNCLIQTSFMA